MKRFVRILKKIGKGLLIVLALVVVTLVIARFVFVHQLNDEIAKIKARGEPLTEADLAGPPIPDAENSALIYEKAFTAMPKGDTKAIGDAIKRGDAKSLAEARRMMKPYAKALSLARQAASMPKCRFVVKDDRNYKDRPTYSLRRLMVLLAFDSVLKARSGDVNGAVDSLLAGIRIGKVSPGEKGLMGALVQGTFIRIACSALADVAKYVEIGQDQARRLDAELAVIYVRAVHRRALQEERAHFLRISEAQQGDPVRWVRSEGIPVSFWDAVFARVDPAGLAWQHVIFVGDRAAYLRFMASLIEGDYRTYSAARALEREAERSVPRYAILTMILGPVQAECVKSMFGAEAQVQGSRVFLALLAYRDRHGTYPQSLAELRKDPGWEVPADPFTGKDFVYRRQAEGFLLYSLGPDMKDNGGRPQPKGKAYRTDAEYDIPWQMTR